MKLADKVAVVTGGGTGMGRATCLLFAQEGAKVLVNYAHSQHEAEAVASEINASGGTALAYQADVTSQAQAKQMMDAVASRWGRLDVLVNNAGWSTRVPHDRLDDLTDEIWDRTLNTNLRGPFYCVRAAVPLLRRQTGASIVNIASVAAFHASGSSMAYAAAKAGLVTLTRSLARVLAPDIRVNVLCPGFVKTRFAGWPEEAFEKAREVTPLRRLATVEDVAKGVLFLAADAEALTGEAIVIDGGVFQLGRSR